MKHVFWSNTFVKMAGLFAAFIILVSWQPGSAKTSKKGSQTTEVRDTTAPKSNDINQIDLQLNLDSVMQQVNIAMSKIDYNKMNSDIQKAMSQIDYNKINQDINTAMKNINWNDMKVNVSLALDSAKMAIDKINWDDMKVQISKAQAEAKQQINTADIQKQVQLALKDAQKSLQAAKAELANYKGLISSLEKDGLIDTSKPYKVQLKDGDLYINGVKQSKAVTDKYSKYYSGKKNFSIGDGDDDKEADL